MKKVLGFVIIMLTLSMVSIAQEKEGGNEYINVPAIVKKANLEKYPESKTHHITWEKEKGNYEANWGGKDGEASFVAYTPSGVFVKIVKEIPTNDLPKGVLSYVKEHYKSVKFGDVGKVLDAQAKTSYEVEINGKDVIFDENGNFVKTEK